MDATADGDVGSSGDYIRGSDRNNVQVFYGRTAAGNFAASIGQTGTFEARIYAVRMAA